MYLPTNHNIEKNNHLESISVQTRLHSWRAISKQEDCYLEN